MGKSIVTTSHKPDAATAALAEHAAAAVGADVVDRGRMSLAELRKKYNIENILVVNREQVVIHSPQGEYFFHPSMSVPRIKALRQGKPDHMLEAMALEPGDTVLDCTLGLGADAIVAAYAVGAGGRVVGLESAPELAFILKQGLAVYTGGSQALREAMSRIEVICRDCVEFLVQQADDSFDIVYLDPMFRVPRRKSSSMEPVRGIVNAAPITGQIIGEARRVARKRVVMKENVFSQEFARLGFVGVTGGRYSPVAFGIIDKREAER